MSTAIGLLLAFVGGAIQGTFFLPMKYMKGWRWENGWFVFTLSCCLVLPALLAFGTTPGLLDVYRAAGLQTVGLVLLFGMGWGLGAVLYGLGVNLLGMALGIVVITGINTCLGTLFPILFLEEKQFTARAAMVLGAGLLLMVAGVAVISRAGRLRAEEQKRRDESGTPASGTSFRVGLMVCIVSGILCPSANFAVFFGEPITKAVRGLGVVAPYHLGHALMLPFFLGGWVINTAYCAYLFKKNGSLSNFVKTRPASNSLKGLAMGVLFVLGMVLYYIANANYIPNIGPIVGWPVFLAATMLCSNVIGVLSGEWRGCRTITFAWLQGGFALLVLAVVLAGLSNVFVPVGSAVNSP
jgi:L-rhamnose-H+ transport protein